MDGWIIVRNWDRFQHYKTRRPPWIKLYTDINSSDEWLDLSTAARGMLTTIWAEYARSGGHLRVEKCMQLCGKSARSSHLDSLIHAGFVRVVASKPLALPRALKEVEVEEEKERTYAHARESKPVEKPTVQRANVIAADPVQAITAMIRNGAITSIVDLDAEIAGYRLNGNITDQLRELLP